LEATEIPSNLEQFCTKAVEQQQWKQQNFSVLLQEVNKLLSFDFKALEQELDEKRELVHEPVRKISVKHETFVDEEDEFTVITHKKKPEGKGDKKRGGNKNRY